MRCNGAAEGSLGVCGPVNLWSYFARRHAGTLPCPVRTALGANTTTNTKYTCDTQCSGMSRKEMWSVWLSHCLKRAEQPLCIVCTNHVAVCCFREARMISRVTHHRFAHRSYTGVTATPTDVCPREPHRASRRLPGAAIRCAENVLSYLYTRTLERLAGAISISTNCRWSGVDKFASYYVLPQFDANARSRVNCSASAPEFVWTAL